MRRFVFFMALFSVVYAGIFGTSAVYAQPYPTKPIQLVTSGTPGNKLDVTCRIFAEEIGKIIKNQVVVMNKPGASMTLAVDFAVRSKNDGYTFLYASATPLIYAPVTNPEIVPYYSLTDLDPFGGEVVFPFTITVQEGSQWKTFPEWVDYAKKNPEKIRVATPGIASQDNFNVQIVESLAGIKLNAVPFQGRSAVALLGGHVEATFSPITEVAEYVNAKQLRLLLLSSKMAQYPNVPTIRDFGYKQDLLKGWFAFFAPSGTPAAVKSVMVPAIEKAFKNPGVRGKIEKMGYSMNYKSPEEFKKSMIAEIGTAREVGTKIGFLKK